VKRLVGQFQGGETGPGRGRLLEGVTQGPADDRSHEQRYDRSNEEPGPERPVGDPDGESGGADLGAASGGQGGQGQRHPEGVGQVGQLFDLSTSAGRYGRPVLGVEGGVEQLRQ
jgi:hypothetical protein